MNVVLTILLVYHAIARVGASVGQVPSVNGIMGGVPSIARQGLNDTEGPSTSAWENPLAVPGKVRLVENSGLCGKFIQVCSSIH